jgi:hypothetical protein
MNQCAGRSYKSITGRIGFIRKPSARLITTEKRSGFRALSVSLLNIGQEEGSRKLHRERESASRRFYSQRFRAGLHSSAPSGLSFLERVRGDLNWST